SDGGGDFNIGFSRIQPAAGNTTPTGVAIFGGRSNNVLFTEAGVPAAPLLRSARIYAEINASVNTGLAIANPNSQPANVTFHFATSDGVGADQTISIPSNSEIAKYLNEPAFGLAAGTTLQGTFTFSSDVPVAVVALRLLRNERGEELLTTLPVTDLSAPTASGTAYLGHFADGSGATSQVILVNPTDSAIAGTMQFFGQGTTAAGSDTGTIQTGIAIANLDAAATTVNLELMTLDGASAGPPVSVNLPGNGQIAKFAHELFNMTFPFKGIIRISGGTSAGLAV